MKKISYSLNFGLIGSKSSSVDLGKSIILDYLRDLAIKYNPMEFDINYKNSIEFLIVFDIIPIKIKTFLADNLEELIYNYNKVQHLDLIVLLFNIYDVNAIGHYNKNDFNEFKENFRFQGTSVLAGLDIKDDTTSENSRIDRQKIIDKVNELNLLYAFELKNEKKDIAEFFFKILKDFLFKFKSSSPEMFELAKAYANKLRNQIP
ncbi:MAG: hypothetical protein ACFFAO_02465 [Candidatus Hermodarchaeota archaeon]